MSPVSPRRKRCRASSTIWTRRASRSCPSASCCSANLLPIPPHPPLPGNPEMNALAWNRFQFGFTITYHYLFPQLTMGLAFLIVVFKVLALRKNDTRYHDAARFWGRIFGINFAVGVVTGIPMEFQFGTNWAAFSRAAGGVIGQTLAMEGVFSFFLESSFLGLFLFGEKKLGRIGHWWAAFLVWLGSWLSGYFIVATNAWMQYPTGHRVDSH